MTPRQSNSELNNARIVEPSTPSQPTNSEGPISPSDTTDPAPKAPKKRRKLLPILVIVGVLILLSGGLVAAYALWYQNPDRVMADAMNNLVESEYLQQKTTITSDSVVPLGFFALKFNQVSLESTKDANNNNSMQLDVDMEFNSRPYKLGAEARVMEDGNLYFKLNDIKDAYLKFLKDMGVGELELSARANELAAEIDNTWVKVGKNPNTGSDADNELSCIMDEVTNADEGVTQAIKEVYRDNKFMVVDEKLEAKDGNLGYRISLDQDKAKQFAKALEGKKELQGLRECVDSDTQSNASSAIDDTEAVDTPTVDIWVSRWTHELQEVNFSFDNQGDKKDSESRMQFKGVTKLDYDEGVTIVVPENARSLEEWQRSIEQLNQEMSRGASLIAPQQPVGISSQL